VAYSSCKSSVWLAQECMYAENPPLGFDPQTVQPVASRYTDYDIPAHPELDAET